MEETNWKTYEETARFLIERFGSEFGVDCVEGKKKILAASGTQWEIDAKAMLAGGEAFLVVECKRWKNGNISQEIIGGLAYRIIDLGASGGIIVSPCDLQYGAKMVASHASIKHIKLTPDSTKVSYLMRHLERIFAGESEHISIRDSATVTFHDGNGSQKT
mgnify:CR=1 FL=1